MTKRPKGEEKRNERGNWAPSFIAADGTNKPPRKLTQ